MIFEGGIFGLGFGPGFLRSLTGGAGGGGGGADTNPVPDEDVEPDS